MVDVGVGASPHRRLTNKRILLIFRSERRFPDWFLAYLPWEHAPSTVDLFQSNVPEMLWTLGGNMTNAGIEIDGFINSFFFAVLQVFAICVIAAVVLDEALCG